ncbi:MAG: alanine racemase, partial [Methylophilaceae bacterium]
MRPIQAIIKLDALRHNLTVAQSHAPHSKVMAVIKANGYGHGLLNVAQGLRAADGFAVLGIDEAITLRQAGFDQTLLLLEGLFAADELQSAAQHNINFVVHCFQQIDMLEQAKLAHPVSVFLKMNTGMNRLGFVPADFAHARQRLADCP